MGESKNEKSLPLTFWENFFQIKKIIALLLTLAFCYLSIVGIISSAQFLTVFSVIIAFYFGQSTVKQTAIQVTEANKQEPGSNGTSQATKEQK